MKRYLVRIPSEVEAFVRRLHPIIKTKIRNAIDEIGNDPYLGKPLKDELAGLFSFRVSTYRVVYQVKAREVLVEIIEVAARKIVYQKVASFLKKIH